MKIGGHFFQSLRHLLHVLGEVKFKVLAHHLLVGNQVIVRGSQPCLIFSIFEALKKLLPLGCCRVINFSDVYLDSFKCNLLGMNQGISVPMSANAYIIFDIIEPESAVEAQEDNSTSENEAASDTCAIGLPSLDGFNSFEGYVFILTTPLLLPNNSPAVLTRMMTPLSDFELSDSVVDQCLVCIKEEWMNKVKLVFKFTKAGGRRLEEDTHQILQLIDAKVEDKAVIQFWMTGLSVQHRNSMLASSTP